MTQAAAGCPKDEASASSSPRPTPRSVVAERIAALQQRRSTTDAEIASRCPISASSPARPSSAPSPTRSSIASRIQALQQQQPQPPPGTGCALSSVGDGTGARQNDDGRKVRALADDLRGKLDVSAMPGGGPPPPRRMRPTAPGEASRIKEGKREEEIVATTASPLGERSEHGNGDGLTHVTRATISVGKRRKRTPRPFTSELF